MAESPPRPVICVEVVCALPLQQVLVCLELPPGTTARGAVERSQIADRCQEVNVAMAPLAIFGRLVPDDYVLADGDRVAILRALQRDPREARRELAARGETMGRRAAARDD